MQHLPHSAAAAGLCSDCDGFATATVTTGDRRNGTRRTFRVACRTCKGTGKATTPSARVMVTAGSST